MINITDENIFGKVIADALATVGNNPELDEAGRKRCVNAIAKAAARIEQSGTWMNLDDETGNMLIWSDSNEIYEIGRACDNCQCSAFEHGNLCWHRVATRLIQRYTEAVEASECEKVLRMSASAEGVTI